MMMQTNRVCAAPRLTRRLSRPALALHHRAQCTNKATSRALRVHVVAFGPQSGGKVEKGEKTKGFINEMRMVAMKLHTREQAPKEGGAPAPKPQAFKPTRSGYLQFLAESKAVYDVLEKIVAESKHPEYAILKGTGLERSQALAQDIKWFEDEYHLKVPEVAPDGPGATYSKMIQELSEKDPQAFVCHFYNFYFAHTAGGKMIGKKVANMILDDKSLKFYEYDGDVAERLDAVREKINSLAEGWTREQKDHCLEETSQSFKYSGALMKCMQEA